MQMDEGRTKSKQEDGGNLQCDCDNIEIFAVTCMTWGKQTALFVDTVKTKKPSLTCYVTTTVKVRGEHFQETSSQWSLLKFFLYGGCAGGAQITSPMAKNCQKRNFL